MNKNLGRFSRNASEEIRLLLREVHGELHVELRAYGRSARHGGAYAPEPEAILVPVRLLSDLCRVLEETHDRLLKERLVDVPSLTNVISIAATDPITLQRVEPPDLLPDSRSERRVAANLPIECHLLSAPDSWPSQPLPGQVTGEIRVLGSGGAHVWLPEQFPVFSHLAVFMRIGELIFRGQAEVVEAASHPKGGNYRHSLRWISLSPQAKAALSKVIDAAA